MSKEQIIEAIAEYINDAPEEAKKVQVILLGGGGWITCNSWDMEEEDE